MIKASNGIYKPQNGDMAVWCVINPPYPEIMIPVKSPDEAVVLIQKMTSLQLANDAIKENAFGLNIYDGKEWCEWYDEHGCSIDEIIEDMLEDEEACKVADLDDIDAVRVPINLNDDAEIDREDLQQLWCDIVSDPDRQQDAFTEMQCYNKNANVDEIINTINLDECCEDD